MKKVATDPLVGCKAKVLFGYSITNIDAVKNTVQDIHISLNKVRPFTSVIEEVPVQDRRILPGNTLTSSKSKYLDFCSTYEESGKDGLTFEVVVNCIDGRTFKSTIDYPFIRVPTPKCDADLQISCEASDGGPCLPRSNSQECTFRPHYFDFMLSGGLCAASKNNQDSSKFVCVDEGDMNEYTDLFVVVEGIKTKDNYFTGFVSTDEVFTVGRGSKVDSDMKVFIFSQRGGIPIQTFRFHSSCSKNLAMGDSFGGITIAGFRDDFHIVTHRPSDVASTYHLSYKIKNHSADAVFLRQLVFQFNDNEGISVVLRDSSTIGSKSYLSGITPGFNITSDDFEATATLKYGSLPSISSRDCLATAKFVASSCSIKHSKNSRSKSPRTKSCSGKTSKSRSKRSHSNKKSKGGKGKALKSLKYLHSPAIRDKGRKGKKGSPYKNVKIPTLSAAHGKGGKGSKSLKSSNGKLLTKGKGSKSAKNANPSHISSIQVDGKGPRISTHPKGKRSKARKANGKNSTRNMTANE